MKLNQLFVAECWIRAFASVPAVSVYDVADARLAFFGQDLPAIDIVRTELSACLHIPVEAG